MLGSTEQSSRLISGSSACHSQPAKTGNARHVATGEEEAGTAAPKFVLYPSQKV